MPDHEDFDLFADVSHHGSSFFDLFAFGAAPPLVQPTPLHHNPRDSAAATPFPAPPSAAAALLQGESYCTADPSDGLDRPAPPAHLPAPQPQPQCPPRSAQSKRSNQGPAQPRGASGAALAPAPAIQKGKGATKKASSGAAVAAKAKASAAQRAPPPAPVQRAQAKVPVKPASAAPGGAGGRTGGAKAKSAALASEVSLATGKGAAAVAPGRPDESGDLFLADEGGGSEHSYDMLEAPRLGTGARFAGEASGEASVSMLEDGQSKDTHNSHTRRCRAKVNNKFQELLSILPAPPSKTGIKHKAQILDYTIRVFRDIHAKKLLLEAELALSSRVQLNNWVDSIVAPAESLNEVLRPYLSLVCTKGAWKYAEAWVPASPLHPRVQAAPGSARPKAGGTAVSRPGAPTVKTPNAVLRLGLSVIPAVGNSDDPDLQMKLERFRDSSRSYTCKPRKDLPGRVLCTMHPEWLPLLTDEEAFQRSSLAGDASLSVCFGTPLFVRGHVAAVAVFFDTEWRHYDATCMDLAGRIAGLIGNAYGAKSVKADER